MSKKIFIYCAFFWGRKWALSGRQICCCLWFFHIHTHTLYSTYQRRTEKFFFHDQATYVTLKTRKLHRQWTLITIFHSLFSLLSPTTFNIRSLSSRCSRHTKDLWWWFSSLTFFVCSSSVLNCVMNCSTRWLQMLTTSSHH